MEDDLHQAHADLDTSHWWFVARRRIIEQTLIRHHGTARADGVLDIGCGAGGLIPVLQRFGAVTAVEGDPHNARVAQERNPTASVRVGMLPDAIAELPRAGLVTAFDVIEHLDDDVSAIEAMAGRMEPGGALCVTVPALPRLWSAHDEANEHRRRYTRRTLDAALRAAGLDVAHLSYFNMLLLPMVAAARAVERRRPSATPGGDFGRSMGRLDDVLGLVFGLERHLVPRMPLPIGVSLIAVAHRQS